MQRLLEGVRVIDFTWIGAGSYTTKLLADLGADVIKIETSKRLDSLRMAEPYKDGIPGINRSGYFADRNTSKRSITINIKTVQGLDLVKQLIANADIVANNFTPGVMDKLGLGYETLKKIQPALIYLSMSVQGNTGPEHKDLGYGLTIAAVTGLMHLTGLPEREPAGTGTNFPDHIPNPTHAAFAILAALRHKRRTGQGQYIDIAQIEPTLSMLAPAVMDYFVNNEIQTRTGNRDAHYAPQGVFPCEGTDRWIAISIQTDAQWAGLCKVLPISSKPEWVSNESRLNDQDAIEAQIEQHSRKWDNVELAQALQHNGVPAGPVNDARDVLENDLQLKHRQHWVTMNHPEMGISTYNGSPFKFSSAESQPQSPAPLLGEHTFEVASNLLQLSTEQIQELIDNDILV